MNRRRLKVFILIFMPHLCIGFHQGLLAKGILNLHLGFSSNINARLQDNLSKQAAEGGAGIALISGLQHNTKDIFAQAKWQSQAMAYKNYALFRIRSLRLTIGQRVG